VRSREPQAHIEANSSGGRPRGAAIGGAMTARDLTKWRREMRPRCQCLRSRVDEMIGLGLLGDPPLNLAAPRL
jgi:hypothetical protein